MEYLTAKSIITINTRIQQRAGTTPIIRDAAALNYIVESARQEVFGQTLYRTVEDLATFYLIKVTKKHIFNDANKRTAFQSMVMFLKLNGYELSVDSQIKVAEQIVSVAKVDGEPDMLRLETLDVVSQSIHRFE